MDSRAQLLYAGSKKPQAKCIPLRAGPLSMVFDPEIAFLRHVRLGDHEVIRAIYGAVRDHNWATASSAVSNLDTTINPDSFSISFDVRCQLDNIDYFWRGNIQGQADGQVIFHFAGEARSEFQRNRIGLCVLHPIQECAGKSCLVKHVDGSSQTAQFPKQISPAQPIFDIATLEHEIASTAVKVEIAFQGETFEMEDQRNWADASYKTYSTPQRLPKPVTVKPGDKVNHSVTIRLKEAGRPVLPVVIGRPPQISISTTPVLTLPPIGLGVNPQKGLSATQIKRLQALKLNHLRVDLALDSVDYPARLAEASTQAQQCGASLQIALMLTDNAEAELKQLLGHIQRIKPLVSLWLVFHQKEISTRERWVRAAQAALQFFAPNVLFAAGTKEFFMDVNGLRPEPASPQLLCYTLNPQVHQPDNVTIVENLAGLAYTVESARQFTSKPVVLSPITLKPPTPFAPATRDTPKKLPNDVDPRQMSLLGAGWTLGSLARLAATGNVHSLTYFETVGWRGVMETEAGSPLPDQFPSLPGSVFPLYHVFADIADFPGRNVLPTHSSHPLQVEAVTLTDGKRRRILAANLTPEPQDVKVKTGTATGTIRYLDERNGHTAASEPEKFRGQPGDPVSAVSGKVEMNLLPFALACLDL